MHNIVFLSEFITGLIKSLPIWVDLFLIIVLNLLFVLPLTFNLYIIPSIEKKIGQKLEYGSSCFSVMEKMYTPLAVKYWGHMAEVSMYIMFSYLTWKFKFPRYVSSSNALAKVNYKMENLSRIEIFMSFYFFLNGVGFFIVSIPALFNH